MALRRSDPSQTGGDINAAEVAVEVDAEASPALGLLLEAPGPQYRVGSARTLVDHEDSSFVAPEPAAIGLGKDGPALARSVLGAETQFLGLAKQASYALAVV